MPRVRAALACLALPASVLAQDGGTLALGGYLKNQLLRSRTAVGPQRDFVLDVSRARLKLQGELAPALGVDLQYDHEVLLGDYLHTPQFALQKQAGSGQFWRLEQSYLDRRDIYARHRLYRASIVLRHGGTDIKLGRQRIAWGTGRFWSPLDVLNPIAATQLEREERPGVDALLVEQQMGPLQRMSVVYAPAHGRGQSSAAAQYHGNAHGADYSLVWGKYGPAHLVGADLATQLGDLGLRAEAVQVRPNAGARYRRILLGADYAFANTLTLSAELFHNGQPSAAATGAPAGALQLAGRRYAGAFASYELTPLWKVVVYAARNLSDHSVYVAPSISWSIRANLEWTLGVQHFGGAGSSEFGRMPDVAYTHVQWFF